MKIAFVCMENAGRSQMAAAFAHRIAGSKALIISGGTRPARRVDPLVVEAMKEVGIDLSDIRPRAVSPEELEECDYVVTMGCNPADICPVTFHGDARDWNLPDPKGMSLPEVRVIRDEIERRTRALMREIGLAQG
jgi:arsenate reductase